MSSTESNSIEPSPEATSSNPSRSSLLLVVLTIGLLGVLVGALNPSALHLTPAPLRPLPAGCPPAPPEFTPTNFTEIPGVPLEAPGQAEKNRALLRLNMEPCSCGCGVSLAACRVSNPSCESSKDEVKKIASDEMGVLDKNR